MGVDSMTLVFGSFSVENHLQEKSCPDTSSLVMDASNFCAIYGTSRSSQMALRAHRCIRLENRNKRNKYEVKIYLNSNELSLENITTGGTSLSIFIVIQAAKTLVLGISIRRCLVHKESERSINGKVFRTSCRRKSSSLLQNHTLNSKPETL
ncbi:hypothetical protein Patl1_32103 [Pistacia atlantica]|uniref:Uncharacterized protein n=1 Tax=Pistacia atlantica TaxID=434234 RepID=A0ACC1AN13_9ROSI|nr:hypothetical protein Patl1_32103 [Pistacia atlantica]